MFNDEQLRRKNIDIDTLKRWIRYKIGGYRLAITDITTTNLLYRGVSWPQRPNKISDVSYPPPDKATLNRANRAGKPMFYGSLAATGVFYEIRAKQGDFIALSEWEVIEPLWMHNLGYHQDALRKMGVLDITPRARLLSPLPNESAENAKLRRDLSLAFTKNVREGQEYRYKQSIAINEMLFDGASPLCPIKPNGPKYDRAAGTVYPAMQLRGVADNIVLWPEFVDSSLKIKSVRYILVENADEAKSSYVLNTIAIANTFSNGDMIWQDSPLPEDRRRTYFALEDGMWVQRDSYGRITDVH